MATSAYIHCCRTIGFGPLVEYQVYSIAGKPLGSRLEMTSVADLFAIERLDTIAKRADHRDYLRERKR